MSDPDKARFVNYAIETNAVFAITAIERSIKELETLKKSIESDLPEIPSNIEYLDEDSILILSEHAQKFKSKLQFESERELNRALIELRCSLHFLNRVLKVN